MSSAAETLDEQVNEQIAAIRARYLAECKEFANDKGYVFTQTLGDIDDGVQFYLVNVDSQIVQKVMNKKNMQGWLPTIPAYIVAGADVLEPQSILKYIDAKRNEEKRIAEKRNSVGGKRKSRRNRKKIKSRKGKSRKNRRKSNRRRR